MKKTNVKSSFDLGQFLRLLLRVLFASLAITTLLPVTGRALPHCTHGELTMVLFGLMIWAQNPIIIHYSNHLNTEHLNTGFI